MTNLSPAAQAILTAYENSPLEYDNGDFTACAAVLRAVADQVIPEVVLLGSDYQEIALQEARKEILDIAAELESR